MNSVKKSLMTLCITMVLLVSIAVGITAIISIRSTTDMAMSDYKNAMNEGYDTEIRSQVQTVITILQTEYDKFKAGELTEEEAKKEACDIVRNIRYGDEADGYFWIDDTDYMLVMHPILLQDVGKNRYDLEDQNGVMIIQEILKVAQSEAGGGYNEFYFTKSDGVTVAPKIAYSQIFKPWNWVVSTGNYVDDMQIEMGAVEKDIQSRFVNLCVIIIVVSILMIVVACVMAFKYGNTICTSLEKINQMATRLSNGDLTTPIDVKDKSELGRTANALNEAQKHMVGLIKEISQTSKELDNTVTCFKDNFSTMEESIESVSTAVNEITDNTRTQADSTTQASKSVEEIVDGIGEASKEILLLDNNSKTMMEYSDKSMAALNKLIEPFLTSTFSLYLQQTLRRCTSLR